MHRAGFADGPVPLWDPWHNIGVVLRHRLQDQPTWEFARRILVDEHFEFRGGRLRDNTWSGIPSRVEDG